MFEYILPLIALGLALLADIRIREWKSRRRSDGSARIFPTASRGRTLRFVPFRRVISPRGDAYLGAGLGCAFTPEIVAVQQATKQTQLPHFFGSLTS